MVTRNPYLSYLNVLNLFWYLKPTTKKMRFTLSYTLSLTLGASCLELTSIPTISYNPVGGETLNVSILSTIVVDAEFADFVDNRGLTLLPPTLNAFANTFSDDLYNVFGWKVPARKGVVSDESVIFLTLGDPSDYLDIAGRQTSEGYSINVTKTGVTVSGASPLGVWWGTRTILQHLIATDKGTIPLGHATDSPGWANRGLMLDVGRHYYPVEFLEEMCAYMSFYKQNVFHLHLSDNLWNNVRLYNYEHQMQLYSAFRLWSDDASVEGLNKRRNESYTREQFDWLQNRCAARGVTVIPEIEAPGHALVISQWKPEIGFPSDLSLLNISHPDTIPTVKTIWEVFLPWFHCKVVHMGADEYQDPTLPVEFLVSEYTRFVNEISDFIAGASGKQTRIWGTFSPREGGNTNKNVSIQHWAPWEANPLWDFIDNGYEVLNSGDWAYMVGKWSEWYGQELNLDFIFGTDPTNVAGPLNPSIFDPRNSSNNAPLNERRVLGHIAAQWNDYGPNATTVLEAYHQWKSGLGALADKQWGGKLTREDYASLYSKLQPHAPGQNLDRRIPSVGSIIVEYDFAAGLDDKGMSTDKSGNNYHAISTCQTNNEGVYIVHGCTVSTPLDSKGRNYTLEFTIKPTSDTKGPIFTGSDSALWFGNGTSDAVMLVSGDSAYALNYTFPVGQWTKANLIGSGRRTFLDVGEDRMEFLTILGWQGDKNVWTYIGIEAPLKTIGGGGFTGIIAHMKLIADD
ncbi:Beta-hexosaminidase [Paramyrothecium foliicola]|nr:Beta-hexosaminidase [Paramyrothecium foliicola]